MAILKNTKSQLSSSDQNNLVRQNLQTLFSSDNSKNYLSDDDDHDRQHPYHRRNSEVSTSFVPSPNPMQYNNNNYSNPNSTLSSPYLLTPSPLISYQQYYSPYNKSPWIYNNLEEEEEDHRDDQNKLNGNSLLPPKYGLIGSLYREEGHVYSLTAHDGLLYTGSDSKNIRVWKNMREFSGFKSSSSGLVKAIVLVGDRIFTGHQDGKIRVWRVQRHGHGRGDSKYTRVGTLPTTRDLLTKSMNPKNYVEVRRRKNVPWIKHYDAVSCICVDEERGLLYSGSWDKTVKVWRVSDFKCLESIHAHDDAVNSVAVAASYGLVFTGSADGTVKSWRRELVGKSSTTTRHIPVETLLNQDHAVTSLAVSCKVDGGVFLYAGSSDGLVNFWSRDKKYSMSHGGALRGHGLAVLCLAVGGSLVVSGSADKNICVWRREDESTVVGTHTCIAVLTGHGGPVKCLAVEEEEEEEEDGDHQEIKNWIVYSGSLDKRIKVWRVCE